VLPDAVQAVQVQLALPLVAAAVAQAARVLCTQVPADAAAELPILEEPAELAARRVSLLLPEALLAQVVWPRAS
jgi:hypothetical protein